MTTNRVLSIRTRLIAAFDPTELEVSDESDLHIGHEGAKDGKGHFRVKIISDQFKGRKPLECHRMVFAALGKLMDDEIHALSITALTSDAPESN